MERRYGNAIGAPLYFSHPFSLEHDTGYGHPERPDRIRAVEAELESRDWCGYERREAPRVSDGQLLRVHPREHIDSVRRHSEGAAAFDLDTQVSTGSWEAALRSAGGACALVEALLSGEAPCGVSALRPPGHHAETATAMGFCLFNNVAVAARHALESMGAERVLVLDWDVHHGNGTNAIFHASREVLFVSLHQWPFYPGTGELSDSGAGDGLGFSINLPVPGGSGEETWLPLVEHVVMPAAREFGPDLVLICAGYDAHRDDPIGGCVLEAGSFAEMARQVRGLDVPVGAVLEGGYDLGALAQSLAATMEALRDGGEPASYEPNALTERAAEQVGRFWSLAAG